MSRPNEQLAKSYVWHNDKCYFISTIDRDSSAMEGPQRYAETMVWEYDWEGRERGEMVFQDEAPKGSIAAHLIILGSISKHGLKELTHGVLE